MKRMTTVAGIAHLFWRTQIYLHTRNVKLMKLFLGKNAICGRSVKVQFCRDWIGQVTEICKGICNGDISCEKECCLECGISLFCFFFKDMK
jgi:hypothetical protein